MADFYCEEALSGRTLIKKVLETENVLAYHHTRPHWPVHIVVVPKVHISSLLSLTEKENPILLEIFGVIKKVSKDIVKEHGACAILTNLGKYQDSTHLHFHLNFGQPLP